MVRWWKTILLCAMMFSTVIAQDSPAEYTSPDGSLSFEYPHGWYVIEAELQGIFIITNHSVLALANMPEIDQNTLIGFIYPPGTSFVGMVEEPPQSLDEAVDMVFPDLCFDAECALRDFFFRKGVPAVRVNFHLPVEINRDLEGALISLQMGETTFLSAMFLSGAGGLERFETQINLIIDTLKYKTASEAVGILRNPEFTTLDFTREFSSNALRLRFKYPEDWGIKFIYGAPHMANSQRLSNLSASTLLAEDEVRIAIVSPSMLNTYHGIDASQLPADVLVRYMETNLVENPQTADVLVDGRNAAVYIQPMRGLSVNSVRHYAVQLEDDGVLIFTVTTAPGQENRFAGIIPYFLDHIEIIQ